MRGAYSRPLALLCAALCILCLSGCAAPPALAAYTQASVVEKDAMAQYPAFYKAASQAFVIPGLAQGAIPQGMDCVPERGWVIISSYHRNGEASTLAVVDLQTGEMVKAVQLQNVDGSAHTSHVGGVAAGGDSVFVASANTLFQVPLSAVEAAGHMDAVRIAREIPVPTKASYANISNGILWVGEFYHTADGYDTPEDHHLTATDGAAHMALCVGYRLDANGGAHFALDADGVAVPDVAVSTIDRVQGFAQDARGRFYLSQSYGRKNSAMLYAYDDVLAGDAQGSFVVGETQVPLWYLDASAGMATMLSPPMSEGICVAGDALLVLYESGATYYRTDGAKDPTDKVWALRLDAEDAWQ